MSYHRTRGPMGDGFDFIGTDSSSSSSSGGGIGAAATNAAASSTTKGAASTPSSTSSAWNAIGSVVGAMLAPQAPAPTVVKPAGMSTTTKVALAAGGVLALALILRR